MNVFFINISGNLDIAINHQYKVSIHQINMSTDNSKHRSLSGKFLEILHVFHERSMIGMYNGEMNGIFCSTDENSVRRQWPCHGWYNESTTSQNNKIGLVMDIIKSVIKAIII
jgi:hypothetical protein